MSHIIAAGFPAIMDDMGRQKKSQTVQTERARKLGWVKYLGAEVSPELDAAVEACANAERRSKKAVITYALEKYLTETGHWPPPPTD